MLPVLIANVAHYFFGISMFLTSVLLILVVLVQRGRGGGLAGAFGGMGGQSAFGTKAGDVFTKVTVGIAVVWGLVGVLAILVLNDSGKKFGDPNAPISITVPATPEGTPDEPGELSTDPASTTTTPSEDPAAPEDPTEPSAGPGAEPSSESEPGSSQPASDATPEDATP